MVIKSGRYHCQKSSLAHSLINTNRRTPTTAGAYAGFSEGGCREGGGGGGAEIRQRS